MIDPVSSSSAAVVSAGARLQNEGCSWEAAWDHLRGLAVFPWSGGFWEPPTGAEAGTPTSARPPGPGHGTLCSLAQSCLTLLTPWTEEPPGPSVHGILQAEH